MPEFINGPTNFAHLKGIINGIEKDIYLFFDKHLDINNQTRCKSFDSIDISYYLYTIIEKSKDFLDFFMEIRTSQLEKTITNKKDIYINEVINLFKSEFDIIKDNNEENVKYSKTNSRVRLHYLDIRDHLGIFYLNEIITKIKKYLNLLNEDEKNKNKYIQKILIYIKKISNEIELLNKNIKEVIKNNHIIYDKINDKQKYYLNKVLNKYHNNVLSQGINIFLDVHYNAIIKSIESVIININSMLINQFLFDIKQMDEYINQLSNYIIQLYCFFTDAYLLRRVLDKNYVKKCIIYSGGAHSINYIFFLVKYCNFRIIKIHNSSERDVNTLMNKINKEWYSFDVYKLFLFNKIYIQCIHWEPMGLGLNDTISAGLYKNESW